MERKFPRFLLFNSLQAQFKVFNGSRCPFRPNNFAVMHHLPYENAPSIDWLLPKVHPYNIRSSMSPYQLALGDSIPPTPPPEKFAKQDFSLLKGPAYGLGLVAMDNIQAGDLILADSPLGTDVLGQEESHSAVLSKGSCNPDDITPLSLDTPVANPDLKCLPKSAIPFTLSSSGSRFNEVGFFPNISFLNHSCHPNAQQSWNANFGSREGTETVYALRAITVGEEITISYCPEGQSMGGNYLKDVYGFDCICTWCTNQLAIVDTPYHTLETSRAAGERRAISARRRQSIHMSLKDMHTVTANNVPYVMKMAHGLHWNLHYEKIKDWRVGFVYFTCLDASIKVGNHGRARVFALLAHTAFVSCQGILSPDVTKVKNRYELFRRYSNDPMTRKEIQLMWESPMAPSSVAMTNRQYVSDLFMKETWTDENCG